MRWAPRQSAQVYEVWYVVCWWDSHSAPGSHPTVSCVSLRTVSDVGTPVVLRYAHLFITECSRLLLPVNIIKYEIEWSSGISPSASDVWKMCWQSEQNLSKLICYLCLLQVYMCSLLIQTKVTKTILNKIPPIFLSIFQLFTNFHIIMSSESWKWPLAQNLGPK